MGKGTNNGRYHDTADRARRKRCRAQKEEKERARGKESLWLLEAPVREIILFSSAVMSNNSFSVVLFGNPRAFQQLDTSLQRLYTAGGGGVPPLTPPYFPPPGPPPPLPPPPLPMFGAKRIYASKIFGPPSAGTIGGP